MISDESRLKMRLSQLGRKRSPSARLKMSLSRLGKKMSPETRLKMRLLNLGKKISPETRAKMSESHKGKVRSEEHKRNLSKSLTGKKLSEETKLKLRVWNTGRKQSPETVAKRVAKMVGHTVSQETRAKLRLAHLGRVISEETRRKIGLSSLGRPAWNLGKTKYTDERIALLSAKRTGSTTVRKHVYSAEEIAERKRRAARLVSEGKMITFKKGQAPWNKGIEFLQIAGEKHYNWKNGISLEPYGKAFNRRFKREVRLRDGFACRLCGSGGVLLVVHHIDYDKRHTSFDNCISLCSRCHGKTQHGREKWTELFREMLKEVRT